MDINTLITMVAMAVVMHIVKTLASAIEGWLKTIAIKSTVIKISRTLLTSIHLNPVIDAATIFGILWYLHHRFGGQAFIAGSDAPDLIAIGLAAGYFANSFIRGCDAIRRSRQA